MTPPPSGAAALAALLHPTLALASVAFLAHVASLGLRSRERRADRALRERHARRAPIALALVAGNAAAGLLSTWLWRADLTLGRSTHFGVGLAAVALLALAALVARRVPHDPRARRIHPLLGAAALLLALLQVFLGLPLLAL